MAQIDKELIAATGLALIDKHGIAGFTMRAIASALGVTPMAIYHHVKDKAALAALMVELATRDHPLPPTKGDWIEDLCTSARWTRDNMCAHPALAEVHRIYRVWTPAMLSFSERWFALWLQSGLAYDKALNAAKVSAFAVFSMVGEVIAHQGVTLPDKKMLTLLPNARAVLEPSLSSNEMFECAVRALIEGLYHKSKQQDVGVPTAPPQL